MANNFKEYLENFDEAIEEIQEETVKTQEELTLHTTSESLRHLEDID